MSFLRASKPEIARRAIDSEILYARLEALKAIINGPQAAAVSKDSNRQIEGLPRVWKANSLRLKMWDEKTKEGCE